jgi:hypothetical protein
LIFGNRFHIHKNKTKIAFFILKSEKFT